MKNKLIALALTLVMVVGLMPARAFAATATPIDSVDLTGLSFGDEWAGKTEAEVKAEIAGYSGFTSQNVSLVDALFFGSGNNDLSDNGSFVEGNSYVTMIYLKADDGYYFDNDRVDNNYPNYLGTINPSPTNKAVGSKYNISELSIGCNTGDEKEQVIYLQLLYQFKATAHVHGNWQFTANENVLTAACGGPCTDNPAYSVNLKLVANNVEYDQNPHGAGFESYDAWLGEGLVLPAFDYETKGGESVNGVPTEIGDYVASATITNAGGDAVTAKIGFSITAPEKKEYPGNKTASAVIKAEKGEMVSVNLPAIPAGAAYGTPAKANASDKYSVSAVRNGVVNVCSGGLPADTKTLKFQVPVTGSTEYNDYAITVTLNVEQDVPETGDNNTVFIYALIMAAAAAGFCVVFCKKRNR